MSAVKILACSSEAVSDTGTSFSLQRHLIHKLRLLALDDAADGFRADVAVAPVVDFVEQRVPLTRLRHRGQRPALDFVFPRRLRLLHLLRRFDVAVRPRTHGGAGSRLVGDELHLNLVTLAQPRGGFKDGGRFLHDFMFRYRTRRKVLDVRREALRLAAAPAPARLVSRRRAAMRSTPPLSKATGFLSAATYESRYRHFRSGSLGSCSSLHGGPGSSEHRRLFGATQPTGLIRDLEHDLEVRLSWSTLTSLEEPCTGLKDAAGILSFMGTKAASIGRVEELKREGAGIRFGSGGASR
ncbi:hypothetical protein EYF80_035877 [Liparis tanakae]|uniref:Uncharacterized protein n=1 Tax=Liparis tanakae TaxID=230148 RepID=A0A4Z2GL06_9TELE|nr:hypothetical protein EYF80_035877 [Liparis tanakae]